MVEFAHSNSYDRDSMSRKELYHRMRDNAEQHRQQLAAWIESEGLEGEVKDLGAAMAFDLLFATVTPEAAAALNRAPGVVAVTPANDLPGAGGLSYAYA
jgi:hypothetical protein